MDITVKMDEIKEQICYHHSLNLQAMHPQEDAKPSNPTSKLKTKNKDK